MGARHNRAATLVRILKHTAQTPLDSAAVGFDVVLKKLFRKMRMKLKLFAIATLVGLLALGAEAQSAGGAGSSGGGTGYSGMGAVPSSPTGQTPANPAGQTPANPAGQTPMNPAGNPVTTPPPQGAAAYGAGGTPFGTGSNQFGMGTNQFGAGSNQFGLGSNQFGVGSNRFGLQTNGFVTPLTPTSSNGAPPTIYRNQPRPIAPPPPVMP